MIPDLAIVGAGPTGLAIAIEGASRGLACVVVDRAQAPIDKACGEGLMPSGVERLKRLGVELGVGEAHPIEGIRYLDGDAVVEAPFEAGPGLGVRRTVLSAALTRRASELGVDLRHGVAAQGWDETADAVALRTSAGVIRARWLIGADGLRSAVREAGGFATRRLAPRFGVRRHFQARPWSRHVEVHWGDAAEAYVTPVAPDVIGVAVLWSRNPGGYDAGLDGFPRLRERLGDAVGPARGAGPFGVLVPRPRRGRVLLAGDAAGFMDALTGEGVGLGMGGAHVLVEALVGERPDAYPARLAALQRRHHAVTRALLLVARRPRLRHRIVTALARRPGLFRSLLAFHEGAGGYGDALRACGRVGLDLLQAGGRAG